MPHIHTEPGQHDLTVSAFIVRTDTPEPAIMLHEHKKLGRFMQFGGHVELHETPWQAIIHELREESGYDLSQLDILQPRLRMKSMKGAVMHPVPIACNTHLFKQGMDHFHTDIEYAFIAKKAPLHAVLQGESDHIRLFTEKDLETMDNSQTFENIREIALFVLREILIDWERVPATEFTA